MKPRRARVLLWALFAAYLGILIWIVLWKLHVPFIGRLPPPHSDLGTVVVTPAG